MPARPPPSVSVRGPQRWRATWLHGSALALLVAGKPVPGAEPAGPRGVAPLREMTTDRPDTTESPYTIDAGHVQIEADLGSMTRNQLDGTRTREWGAAASNLRVGVSRAFEAGIFVAPWMRRSEEPPGGARTTRSGFGDVTLRAKWNFQGNDGGGTATGLIVDLTLPTAAPGLGNHGLAGAVTLPVAGELSGGWEYGVMTRLDFRERASGAGHRLVAVNTATVGRDIAGRLGGYLELTSEVGDGGHVATFNTGLVLRLDANAQLDCGVRLGLTRAADDAALFAGLSRRF